MRTLRMLIASLAFPGIALLLAGCATARRGEPLSGPLHSAAPAVQRGQALFMRHCTQCHPGGDAGIGPALNNKPLPGFMIKLQTRMGFGAMPAFKSSDISRAELNDIVAYAKALRHKPAPDRSATRVDALK